MNREQIVLSAFAVALVGLCAGLGKSSDPAALADIGAVVAGRVEASLPDKARAWGPVAGLQLGARLPACEQVSVRLSSDKLLLGASVRAVPTDKPTAVRLVGAVATPAQRSRALMLASETVGVEEVFDELELTPPAPAPAPPGPQADPKERGGE